MAITAQDVKDLIPDSTVSDAIVLVIIGEATTFVNSVLVDCDSLTDAEKESIAKWLAAHMVVSGPERQAKREKLGDAEVEYDAQSGVDLASTTFGRMALILDRCGKLKAAGKQVISITAITSFE